MYSYKVSSVAELISVPTLYSRELTLNIEVASSILGEVELFARWNSLGTKSVILN